jgi:hypothetical protein
VVSAVTEFLIEVAKQVPEDHFSHAYILVVMYTTSSGISAKTAET